MRRPLLTAVIIATALLALLLAATAVLTHTEAGRQVIARQIEKSLSTSDMRIELEGLSGDLFNEVRVNAVTVMDSDGPWLSATDIAVTWRPWALLDERLHMTRLSVAVVKIDRYPVGGAAATEPVGVPQLPFAPVMDQTEVETIIFSPAFVGKRMSFRLSGQLASVSGETIATALRLEALEGAGAALTLDAELNPGRRTLALKLDWDEPEQGLVGRLLDMPHAPAMRLSVSGEGPLADWPGAFNFETGPVAAQPDIRIAGTASAKFLGVPSLRLTGRADVSTALPPQLAALGAAPVIFDFITRFDRDAWAVSLQDLSVQGGAWRVVGSAALTLDDLALDGSLEADLERGVQLAKGLTFDAGHVKANLGGYGNAPELNLSGRFAAPRVTDFSAQAVSFEGRTTVAPGGNKASFDLRARLDKPHSGDDVLDALMEPGIQLATHGELLTETGYVVFDDVTFDGPDFAARGAGWFDTERMYGQLTAEGNIPDLAKLSRGGIVGLEGRARLSADLRADAKSGAGRTDVDWQVTVERPKTGLASLDPWLGSALEAKGVISADAGVWQFDALTLRSGGVALEGQGLIHLAETRIEGQFNAQADTLTPLGNLLGEIVAGRAQAQGSLSGALADPDLNIRLEVTEPRFGAVRGELAVLDVQARTVVRSPSGQAAARFRFGKDELVGESAFHLLDGQTLSFSGLRVQGAGTKVNGQGVLLLPQGLATGALQAESADIGPLGRIAGLDFGGRLSGSLTLDHPNGQQRLNAEINIQNLDLAPQQVRVARLGVRVSGQQDAGVFGFKGDAQLSAITTPLTRLDLADVRFQGTPTRVELDLNVQGPKNGVEALSLQAHVAREDVTWSADIAALGGRVGALPIALTAPMQIRYSPARLSVECFTLSVAEGQARACVDFVPERVDATLALSGLPVAALAPWAPTQTEWPEWPKDGVVDLDLTLHGASRNPVARFRLGVDGVRLSMDEDRTENVNLSASGAFDRGVLAAEADLSGPADTRAHVRVRLPGALSLSPLVAELAVHDPFEAELSLDGALDGVQKFLPLDPHRVQGTMEARINARGSLSAPQWSGRARLFGGRYENLKTGTVLTDLEADLQGVGDKLVIQVLRSGDGEGGSLEGRGEMLLASGRNAQLNVTLDLKNLFVIRRDDITAVASGVLQISGATQTPHIAGELVLAPVEIRIPDTLPAEVVELQVTQTLGTARSSQGKVQDQPQPWGVGANGTTLDLTVDIPARMFLRGRGLTSEWAGRLKVVRQGGFARIEGALKPLRGDYRFAGKTFRLSEGSVAFTGGEDPLPTFDLSAEYTRRDFKALVRINGVANAPKITLSSVPELPQDEIISRVLFNRSTGQLTVFEAAQLAEAVAQLSGNQSFDGGGAESLRRAIGVDVLRVEEGEPGQGPSTTAGKYVTDEVYVGAKQGTTPQSTGATIEIELSPNLTLDSEVRQDQSSKVGVKWKWDY